MNNLISFELQKLTRNKGFLGFLAILLICNIFTLWFVYDYNAETPLDEYKGVSDKLATMNISEQGEFLNGDFEEQGAIDNLRKQYATVAGYGEYLDNIKEQKEELQSLSIIGGEDGSFSQENILKSAEDHASLTTEGVAFYPENGFVLADKGKTTDIFLFLAVILAVGILFNDEKEKKIHLITRATRNGRLKAIGSRLIAIFVICLMVVILLYGSNFVYGWVRAGMPNLSARIQSMAFYSTNCHAISIGAYLGLSILMKATTLFSFAALMGLLFSVISGFVLPTALGLGLLGISFVISTIPAIKYLSSVERMQTWYNFGVYKNISIFENPISHDLISVALTSLWLLITVGGLVVFYCKSYSIGKAKVGLQLKWRYKPNNSMFGHETYKCLISSKGLAIFLIFLCLSTMVSLGTSYLPSPQEEYYIEFMDRLEGELTDSKEKAIAEERERFEDAQKHIDAIDDMIYSGQIQRATGENMKTNWESILSFKPAFDRIETQYQHIIENKGGQFIYDTGYLYLLGIAGNSYMAEYLILIVAIILMTSNMLAMEKNSWQILSCTKKGKRAIIINKVMVSICCSTVMILAQWILRYFSLCKTLPINNAMSSIEHIPYFYQWGTSISIAAFIGLFVLSQIVIGAIITGVVLLISRKGNNYIQTVFAASIVFAVAPLLSVLGLPVVEKLTLYSLFWWI